MQPSPAPFDADTLTCALVLTGKATPTPAALRAALVELYPAGNGPTVADVLAGGWLVPTIDGRGLRLPPLSLAEQDARLAAADAPDQTRQPDATAPANNSKGAVTEPEFSESLKGGESREIAGNAVPRFSYYRGGIAATIPHAAITPAQLHTVLTSPRHRAHTEALRAAPVGSPQRATLKKGLDYVTPAGTFTRRANTALERTSGLLVLDFDHVPDVGAARAALLADALLAPELVLLFTSPSGDGLKALVRADPSAAHLDTFRAYAAYLAHHYAPLGLVPDEAGKDVARACFVPYAPDAWLAPAYAPAA
ncbi:BT4734/BF3469 family protein [Hymenobacter terrenus]|uniref:BT4734/BF3469 family protein n=1 Tax=Hymenobacter terrenus TaxID=1629124 RepID=UPI000695D949|nr:BT4734/BF3469 family protein [Hymenobacter terrenus]